MQVQRPDLDKLITKLIDENKMPTESEVKFLCQKVFIMWCIIDIMLYIQQIYSANKYRIIFHICF